MAPGASPLFFLRREVRAIFRSRRSFWALVAAVGASSLLPLLRWPASASEGAQLANAPIFALFFFTLLTASLLMLPAFAAPAIAGERERGTLDMLLVTPMSPSAIVLAKAAACLVYFMTLFAATIPAAAILTVAGGMTFWAVLRAYMVTAAAVVSTLFVCLAASYRSERTAQAALRGLAFGALWSSGPLMVPALTVLALIQLVRTVRTGLWIDFDLHRASKKIVQTFWSLCLLAAYLVASLFVAGMLFFPGLACSPFTVIGSEVFGVTGIDVFGYGQDQAAGTASVFYLFYALIVGAGHLIYLLEVVRSPAPPPAETFRREEGGVWTWSVEILSRSPRAILTQVFIDWGEAGAAYFRNPVFLKEARTEFHGGVRMRRPLAVGLLLLVPCVTLSGYHMGNALWVVRPFQIAAGIALLLVPAIAATSFAREVEQGNLDFLRSTRLSLREVLEGKLLGTCSSLAAFVVFSVVVTAMAWLFSTGLDSARHAGTMAALAGLVLLVSIAFIAAGCTCLSIVFGSTLPALVASYGLVLGLFVVAPFLVAMASSWPWPLEILNPFQAMGAAARVERTGVIASPALACALWMGAATVGLYFLARSRLERRWERDA